MAPSTASYIGVLVAFMSWKDNEDYRDINLARKLTDITAKHVLDWFNFARIWNSHGE